VLAAGGREALERFRRRHIAAVVTDMVMPDMDGIELIRALLAERPSLRIVAVSGTEDWADYISLATALGAEVGLRKPLRSTELVQALRECLE